MKLKNNVLICIISYNRQPYLKRCLESLFNNTNTKFDLVIFDNGSKQPTLNLLKHFEDKKWSNGCTSQVIYNETNIGTTDVYYHIFNMRKINQYVMIMGNDTKAPENEEWLNEMVNILKEPIYNTHMVALPTIQYQEAINWSGNTPIETTYGNLLKVPTSISPISLFSPEFLKNFNFKKIDKNNFSYEENINNEERQITVYAKENNFNICYLYKLESELLYFLQTSLGYEELFLYNQWKNDLLINKTYKDFEISDSKYAEDITPLNIEI